jgi:hypothetical protein
MVKRVAWKVLSWVVFSAALFGIAFAAMAQSEATPAPAATPTPPPATDATPAPTAPLLLNLNLEWVNSDICRLIEEIRRTPNQADRRDMVEQIEEMIYKHVEYPLTFKLGEISDDKERERIGTTSDVVDAGSADPLASQIGEAFALYGIAKGYEGYAAAASDQIARAKEIYPMVEALTVRIDNFQDQRPIRDWVKDNLGGWASTDTVRVTFEGKNIGQSSIDKLSTDNFHVQAKGKNVKAYYLAVAQADFLRGVNRYVVTDERLTERRPNFFYLYLPPGKYALSTGSSSFVPIDIEIKADPQKNFFVVETLQDSVTVYAKPDVGKEKKKDQEAKKAEDKSNKKDDQGQQKLN